MILGASKPEQVVENLKALDVIPKLTPAVLERIEKILGTKPGPEVCTYLSSSKHLMADQALVLRTA